MSSHAGWRVVAGDHEKAQLYAGVATGAAVWDLCGEGAGERAGFGAFHCQSLESQRLHEGNAELCDLLLTGQVTPPSTSVSSQSIQDA